MQPVLPGQQVITAYRPQWGCINDWWGSRLWRHSLGMDGRGGCNFSARVVDEDP